MFGFAMDKTKVREIVPRHNRNLLGHIKNLVATIILVLPIFSLGSTRSSDAVPLSRCGILKEACCSFFRSIRRLLKIGLELTNRSRKQLKTISSVFAVKTLRNPRKRSIEECLLSHRSALECKHHDVADVRRKR